MRYQRYLNEKFYDGVKVYGTTFEVFKNPTKKELKEVATGYGYRFIIDFKKKDLYIASDDVFHYDMLDKTPLGNEYKLTVEAYWRGDSKTISYIFMGDTNKQMKRMNSDALIEIAAGKVYKAIPLLEELKKHDNTWLRKYGINPKDITDLIDDTITTLEYIKSHEK
jgi:hypothetical protein